MIHDSFAANEGPGLPNAADKYEARCRKCFEPGRD